MSIQPSSQFNDKLDIKNRRVIELQDHLNKRIEYPFGSLFDIGMGIDLNGNVFTSALEFDTKDIEKIANHSKGNSRVFQAMSREENISQIEVMSKIQVCGLCMESAGIFGYMQRQKFTTNQFSIYIAHCFEGINKKILKKYKIRDSAKQYLITYGLQQFIKIYGTHFISGYINAASFFAQLNLYQENQENQNKIGGQIKFEIGKMISKMAEGQQTEQNLQAFESLNMNSFMDVRGIPINEGAISISDIIKGYKQFLDFSKQEKDPDFPYKAICDSWFQIEEIAQLESMHEQYMNIQTQIINLPVENEIQVYENLIHKKDYKNVVQNLLKNDLDHLEQLVQRLQFQARDFELIRLGKEFNEKKDQDHRIPYILEDYFWAYKVKDKNNQNSNFTGIGYKKYVDGMYFGNLVRGIRQGQGTFKWKNGSRYSGNFVDDKRYGQGVYYNEKGVRIEGKWEQKKLDNGVYTYKDGSKFYGVKNPKFQCQTGIFLKKNGLKFEGTLKKKQLHGYGKSYRNNKLTCEGFWYEGDFLGEKTGQFDTNVFFRLEKETNQEISIFYTNTNKNIVLFHGTLNRSLPVSGKGEFQYYHQLVTGVFMEDSNNKKFLELDNDILCDFQKIIQTQCLEEDSSDESEIDDPKQFFLKNNNIFKN